MLLCSAQDFYSQTVSGTDSNLLVRVESTNVSGKFGAVYLQQNVGVSQAEMLWCGNKQNVHTCDAVSWLQVLQILPGDVI